MKKEIGSPWTLVELQLSKESMVKFEILNRMSTDELAELFIVSSVVVSNFIDSESDRGGTIRTWGAMSSKLAMGSQLVKVEPWGEFPRCAVVLANFDIEYHLSRKSISYDREKGRRLCHIPWEINQARCQETSGKKGKANQQLRKSLLLQKKPQQRSWKRPSPLPRTSGKKSGSQTSNYEKAC